MQCPPDELIQGDIDPALDRSRHENIEDLDRGLKEGEDQDQGNEDRGQDPVGGEAGHVRRTEEIEDLGRGRTLRGGGIIDGRNLGPQVGFGGTLGIVRTNRPDVLRGSVVGARK